MKFKFEIKNWAGEVLFTYESDKEATVREAAEAAVKQKANLGWANLGWANLRWANLGWADLRGANLGWANLGGADLRWADLRGADLGGANLRWADLRGADLGGADLGGADLGGANLGWADLRGAKGVTPKVLQILGSRHALIVRQYGEISIGCHTEPLDWWKEHYKALGKKEGYSEDEIAEYREHILAAERFMERYKLLENPKEEAVGG